MKLHAKLTSDELGGDCGFQRIGYLTLFSQDRIQAGKRVVELEREHGIRVEELAPDDIAARQPMVNLDGIAYGILEPDSGFTDSKKTPRQLVESAKTWNLG